MINEARKNNYFVDVGLNIVKGYVVFGLLLAMISLILAIVFFLIDGPRDAHTKQQQEWCEQYHPTLSFSECTLEAGW